MRRLTVLVIAIGVLMMLMATGALAASPFSGCSVGPSGMGSSTIGGWELMDEATLADRIEASGVDPAEATLIFASEDKNGDGRLCVMTQTLPNDASGNDTWFVSHDNNAMTK